MFATFWKIGEYLKLQAFKVVFVHLCVCNSPMQSLRRLDVFPKFDSKFEQDAREKTIFGAAFSVVSVILIICLVIGEFRYFLTVSTKHELFVDPVVGGDMLIELNVSFPQVPCDLITLDAVNAFGEFQSDMDRKSEKHRIHHATLQHISKAREIENTNKKVSVPTDDTGKPKSNCGSCYGAEVHPGQCCNTCSDVESAYNARGWHFSINDVSFVQCATERLRHAASVAKHEGCNIAAKFSVARVQGNIHLIPGRAFTILGQHMHDVTGEEVARLNLSHIIHELKFGTSYDGQSNPLNNRATILTNENHEGVSGRFNYYLKVVPTTVETALLDASSKHTQHHRAGAVESNQYSVTEHFSVRDAEAALQQHQQGGQQQVIPGVFIVYDLSPIRVRIFQDRPYHSVVHFLLQLCAIVGGVFTVMGIVDALFYHGVAKVRRKIQMGKQN